MADTASTSSTLSLAPLGAGDLIDRAVRFYRKNFWTFIWIAFPPVLAGTLITVGWTMLGRALFSVGSYNSDELVAYYLFTWFGGMLIWLFETVAVLTVMGGASRNFVRHLLVGEPVTFAETYRNTGRRLFGLLGASLLITVLLAVIGGVIFYLGMILVMLAVATIFMVLYDFSPFLAVIFSLIVGGAITVGTGWLFFLIATRFAYIPQVMTVEGQGILAAIGRSMNLAGGGVGRFAALFIFTTVAAYSALALLYVPLMWYAWASGTDVFLSADVAPAWYEIATQLIGQISFILLMPVWMIGLCLLYVDERVRREGYDLELLAARHLGAIPKVPRTYTNPLQPALAEATGAANRKPPARPAGRGDGTTILGLGD